MYLSFLPFLNNSIYCDNFVPVPPLLAKYTGAVLNTILIHRPPRQKKLKPENFICIRSAAEQIIMDLCMIP